MNDGNVSAPASRVGSRIRRFLDRQSSTIVPEDAQAVLEELFPEGDRRRRYVRRFASLMVLSATIAAFGLLADSTAVVIGAMLVAPLMTPINATAAALVRAEGARLARSILLLAGGIVGAIASGYLIAVLVGDSALGPDGLPSEVLVRTFPGLLDLGIGVVAGLAGGYVLTRRDATSALPGVGVAVALVPPLAAAGICLQIGTWAQFRGAMLLFVTNLAAIVFSVALVLVISGFVPLASTGHALGNLGWRIGIVVAAVVAVAVPLTVHTTAVLEDDRLAVAVQHAVEAWQPDAEIVSLHADRTRDGTNDVEARLAGPGAMPPAWRLAEEIQRRFDGRLNLEVAWTRVDVQRVVTR